MRAEDLSRVHWLLIALAVGAGVAWLHSNWSQSDVTQTTGQQEFEAAVLSSPEPDKVTKAEFPYVRGLTIYPPRQADFVAHTIQGDIRPRKSVVRFELLTRVPQQQEKWQYRECTFLADAPYVPMLRRADAQPGLTLPAYLDKLAKDRPWIAYRYAWWQETRWVYILWMGGSVVAIAGIWPFVLNGLIAAGYGYRTDPSEKKESMFKGLFAGQNKAQVTEDDAVGSRSAGSPTAMTEGDLAHIAKMEEGLKDFMSEGQAAAPAEGPGEGPVKPLVITPLEPIKNEAKPDEAKAYGGEFYPTVAHGKKKQD